VTGSQPTLETERLILRPFDLSDAGEVQRLAGDRAIADTTLLIPHPYEDGMAEEWISGHAAKHDAGEAVNFAIVLREGEKLIGSIGLTLEPLHKRAELGFWVGKPYWNRGYCTEAAHQILRHGFEELELNRIFAVFFPRNPASGRVLQKLGMRLEGCLRQHGRRWEKYEDLVVYGILRSEWSSRPSEE
jgi:RimJ/RimL family protein N-acetyltransferase